MAHIGCSDDDWRNHEIPDENQDCFHCERCDLEFSISSAKAKNKVVHCPICQMVLEAHWKNWEPPRY